MMENLRLFLQVFGTIHIWTIENEKIKVEFPLNNPAELLLHEKAQTKKN